MKPWVLQLDGEFHTTETMRRLYATDASAYREMPAAVALPKNTQDIIKLVEFARANGTSLIPRTAGTSLAGQVVGDGIIVDVSKYLNKILEVSVEEGYVRCQPGIVRDDLNKHLAPYGYFFAPETSTASRAMIGGMIGNNSCGANSIVYGTTREHVLELSTVLSDGTEARFGLLSDDQLKTKSSGESGSGGLENAIYKSLANVLSDPDNQQSIHAGYPNPGIHRRNTGYALDMLLRRKPYNDNGEPFNLCQLIAGSEGTLAIITEAKLRLTKIPEGTKVLVAVHCHSIHESLEANLLALKHRPTASELMDHYILEATERSILYRQNRFFIEGAPKALLVVELLRPTENEAMKEAEIMVGELKKSGLGYAHPIVTGEEMALVWGLRKAGLGLLSNNPGDEAPVAVVEDTAVDVNKLPSYIDDFNAILRENGMYSVHYAHAGAGELHLRPIVNLKTERGHREFRLIGEKIAKLVKKYNGSLSGEHGDGRVRAEFIPQVLGQKNYELCQQVKRAFDPENLFNPGKIVDAAPMDTSLRYEIGQETPEFETALDFSANLGMVRAAEQCNGSGDCRKTHLTGGTMCPSYMATRDEKDTTRARANILREMMTKNSANPFASPEIKEVMDLCLSCKGCKSECPSNVDVAKLKAEWQYQSYKHTGIPFRTRLISTFTKGMKLASRVPWAYHLTFNTPGLSSLAKGILGFADRRSMPAISRKRLSKWLKDDFKPTTPETAAGVYLFVDEFTNYNEAEIGKKAVLLLNKLGYNVKFVDHKESGRTYISKGMLDQAKDIAATNVAIFRDLITANAPLVGLEPSSILAFRDEYIDLLRDEEQKDALRISENTFTIEEFLAKELDLGNITSSSFHEEKRTIKVHGHCHQKAISSLTPTKKILKLPPNYDVQMIPSGCCGMAGSFGYEKEHFEVSMAIGELVLFPAVREASNDVIIAAAGTSCRHQIKDGTGRRAVHPVEILYQALT